MSALINGEAKIWHTISIDFIAPETFSEDPETFRDFRLNVEFTNSTTGDTVTLPGFFAADGDSANSSATSGTVWRVNFNPPSEGNWTYTASFRTGAGIAASLDPDAGQAVGYIDGDTGSLTVLATDKTGEDFRAKGMLLQDEGTHFLQHQGSGEYIVKGGPGIPENFLASPDFDNTSEGRHGFENHADDAKLTDPTWKDGKGSNVLGAVNYLSEQGVNSIYLMPFTIGGDGKDVSPYVEAALYGNIGGGNDKNLQDAISKNGVERDDFSVFDVSKLEQWNITFEHMNEKGISIHMLLQETENDQLLNDGSRSNSDVMTLERAIYLREMVACFGHLNGIDWNIGEENTNQPELANAIANYLKALDGYDHPVSMHTYPSQHDRYENFADNVNFDGPSFQTTDSTIRQKTLDAIEDSARQDDPWIVQWTEDSSAVINPYSNNPDSATEADMRDAYWGHLTAGGSGGNFYFKANNGSFGGHSLDQNMDDFKAYQSVWTWTEAALTFFNEIIPFQDMTPQDQLTINDRDYVLAKAGEHYVAYLPYGAADNTVQVNLTGWSNETFDVFWYDPRNGGSLVADGQVQGGGFVSLQGAPPDSAQKDWVVYLRNTDLERVPQPDSDPDPDPNPEIDLETSYFLVDTETDTTLMELTGGASVDLDLVDGLSVSLYALTDGASIGEAQLDFNNGQFTAVERFEPYALFGDNSGDFKPGMALSVGSQNLTVTYRAPDGSLLTTETISFVVSETPPDPIDENAAPSAQDDIVTISEDTPITINALGNDSDPDGDALSVSILNGPSNGAAVVQGNGQILYTPDADTFGVDSITYQVTDPDGATGTATVTINVTAENDAPKPTNDNATVLAGKSVLIDVLANDTDVDGDPLFVTEVDGPATIENGQIRVSTAPEARDPITVTYSVSDGTETRTATLNVDVTPASLPDPDPPARTLITAINVGGSAFTASDGTLFEAYTTGVGRAYSSNGPITGTEDETLFQSEKWSNDRSTGLAFDIALEDGDYEIDLFFADIYNGTSRARERVFDVALEGSTVLDDFDLSGTFGARTATIQTFTVEVTDGTLDIDLTHEIENPKLSAFRVWKVGDAAENTPPVANNDFVQLAEDQNAVFDVLTNDTDPDGTDLTITKLSAATHGTVSLLGDGQVSYTPVPDFFGSDSFTYEVTDADGLTSSATVNVTVTPVNDVPIALNDVLKVDENSTATVDVLANDRDLDSDALALIGVTDGANGSASLTADGQITYTPNADFFGIDTVDYTISDGNGGIATGHIAISVTEIPEPEPDPEPEPILDSALEDFFLVDTSSEAVIANLAQRTVIDMGVVDGLSNLNIATFGTNQGKAVESARMSLNDSAWSTVENIVPYALFGDLGGGSDYKSGTFKEGENAVKVAYYTKNNASGSFLGEDELTIVFDEHAKVGTIYEETFLFDTRNMGHETIEYFNEVDTIDFVDLEDDYTAVVDQIDGNTIYFDDDNSLTIIGVDQVNEFMFM